VNEQSSGTVDATTETAPEQGAVEQTSFESTLLKLASDQGLMAPPKDALEQPVADEPPVREEQEGEPEDTETTETPAEGEDLKDEEEEEQKPADDKLSKLVPLREVIEERNKKQRANERAERVEAELATAKAQLAEAQRQLSQASGPMPTPDSPLIDIQEPVVLDRLERVYELLEEVDVDNVNEDGTVTVPSAIGQDGKVIYAKIDPEQARLAQKRADRVLRKDIPNRRKYLDQRAQIDAGAVEWYPDLKNPEHQFTQLVNQLTGQVLSGNAMSNPETKFWVANAVYGFMKRSEEAQSSNGKSKTAGVKTIVDSSKQKFAPTASRTRAVVERKSSADLATVTKELEKNPSPENAEAFVAAALSQSNRQKTVQPAAE
jgi:hypothetical protein